MPITARRSIFILTLSLGLLPGACFAQNADSNTSTVLTEILTDYAYRTQSTKNTTTTLYFSVENQLAKRTDGKLTGSATALQQDYPTSTVQELKEMLEHAEQIQQHSFRKVQVAKFHHHWVREETTTLQSEAEESTAPLYKTYIESLDTTDSIPLFAEMRWPSRTISFHPAQWTSFPNAFQFGTLTPEVYTAYLLIYEHGQNDKMYLSLDETSVSKTLKAHYPNVTLDLNGEPTTTIISFCTEFSWPQREISRIYVCNNARMISNITSVRLSISKRRSNG